jgi:hypothetical protein
MSTQITDPAASIKPSLNTGEDISIYIAGATAPSAVSVQMLHATVTKATDKAVYLTANDPQARNYGRGMWLPKRALHPVTQTHIGISVTTWRLRSWFKPDRYQSRMFADASVSIISVR